MQTNEQETKCDYAQSHENTKCGSIKLFAVIVLAHIFASVYKNLRVLRYF